MGKFWLHSPNHWALHISESSQQEQPCNVCVAISEVKRPTQTRSHGFWAHHHLSVGGLREDSAVLGVVPARLSEHQLYGHSPSPYTTPKLHRKSQICLGTGSSTAALAELPAQTQHHSREEAWVPLLGIILDTCRSLISELEY